MSKFRKLRKRHSKDIISQNNAEKSILIVRNRQTKDFVYLNEKTQDVSLESSILQVLARQHARACDELIQSGNIITSEARRWKNSRPEQLAGRLAENHHTGTFNANATRAGFDNLRAKTGSELGLPTAAHDISIVKNGIETAQAQVKYHGTPARTTFNISRSDYDRMQKIVPSDQVERVQHIAKRRGTDFTGKRNYTDTAQNASAQIRHDGISSKPLSREQALELAKDSSAYSKSLLRSELQMAAKNGAIVGATIGGGISLISNINGVANGTKDIEEAALDVLKDTAGSALSGAACAGGSIIAKQALIKVGAQNLAKGSAPVAIAMGSVEVFTDIGRLASGAIDGTEFVERTGKTAVCTGTSWGGMELGAGIGSTICPGIGTLIGGFVGGILGNCFGGWLTR